MVGAAAQVSEAEVPSPCIDICRLDGQGLCIGCRRTIEEIMEWPRAGVARKREILRALDLREPPAHSR
jgi:predicted Fe-S protein YdhL (DUF1289 family)